MSFTIRRQPESRIGHGDMLANCRHHIGKRTPFGQMIKGLVACQERNAAAGGNGREGREDEPVLSIVAGRKRQVDNRSELFPKQLQEVPEPLQVGIVQGTDGVGYDRQHHLMPPFQNIPFLQNAAALLRPQVSPAEKTAQIAPSLSVDGIGEHIGCLVGKDEASSGLHPARMGNIPVLARAFLPSPASFGEFSRMVMGPHHPGHGIAIGNPETGHSEERCRQRHFLRPGCALQEGEVGPGADLAEGRGRGHAKMPCRCQVGR